MQLTRHTDYALRTLIYLGTYNDRLCSITEIADAHQISRNHLMKVVNHLVQAGYLESFRGRGGGIRLQDSPEDIRLGEVIKSCEQNLRLVDCAMCKIAGTCRLPRIFHEALGSFFGVLDRYTLSDLIREPALLQS